VAKRGAEQRADKGESVARSGFRLISHYVKLHPLPFTVSVTGAAVYAAATVGSTIVLGRITDRVLDPTYETGFVPEDELTAALIALVAVTVLRMSGVVARRYFAGMTAERVQRSVRTQLSSKYLSLPLAWHQRNPTGQLLAHADSDTEVSAEVLHPLPFSLGVAFLALFSAVSLLATDVWLALVAFAIFPALTLINRVYSSRVEKPAADVQAAVGAVAATAHESFDGALVVKTLGRAEAEGERFAARADELRRNRIKVGYIRAVFEAFLDTLPNLGIVAVVVFGTFRIDAGAMTRGDLVQVAALFTVLALPMRVLGFFLEMVPPSVVARRRLTKVFEQPDPDRPIDPPSLPPGPLSVSVRGLTYSYPGVDASGEAADVGPQPLVLDGVSLNVAPGEVVAVVGSTGSGKSTLCLLLAGLIPPVSGSIEIGGVPIDRLDDDHRTDAVALVFQESFLFADTVRANIDISGGVTDGVSDGDFEAAAAIAQVDRFLPDLPNGYDTVVGERGVTLSGGQRQRVALARALVRQPRLLLLDDATSAVDPKVERNILDGLRQGRGAAAAPTTIIVAQRVSTIRLADRVLYLSGGRIVGNGPHRQLLNDPGYSALVSAYEAAAT
jgi:ABC-type multidrug transport system fused ATPase/permease subunit